MQKHIYHSRSIESSLKEAVEEFPSVVLTGPRQSGKTTLLKHLFASTHGYVSMELPDVQLAAKEDPRGFLKSYPPPVVFDEIQYIPELLPYIKESIDANRSSYGRYILTGSHNLMLVEQVTESLAGRAAMLKLLPFSMREAAREPLTLLPWERKSLEHPPAGQDIWADIVRGYFPELIAASKKNMSLWHAGYVQTYLERDVRLLRQVGSLTQFQSFLRALAARTAQLLNLSEIAKELGLAVNTIKAWVSVLEATHQILLLKPYHANLGKRLVKSPKIFFTDVGTVCHLTGITAKKQAAYGPLKGALMETAVVAEVYKRLLHRNIDPQISFLRTASGLEIDLLVQTAKGVVPIEIKSTSTPRPAMAKPIHKFQEISKENLLPGYVVHAGDVLLPMGKDVTAISYFAL